MRIAIVGSPGVGKTDLAKSMQRALNRDANEAHKVWRKDHPDERDPFLSCGHWSLIDGYIEDLTSKTGTQYGTGAGYVENVSVMCHRWILEDTASNHRHHTITCGSVYDTFAYAALLNTDRPDNEQAWMFQRQLVTVMMNFFWLVEPSGRYDRVFYIPATNDEHPIDATLPKIFEACNLQVTLLTGTKRERLQDALKVTRFIRDEAYAQTTVAE